MPDAPSESARRPTAPWSAHTNSVPAALSALDEARSDLTRSLAIDPNQKRVRDTLSRIPQ